MALAAAPSAVFGALVIAFCVAAARQDGDNGPDAYWFWLVGLVGLATTLAAGIGRVRRSRLLVLGSYVLAVAAFIGVSFAIVGGSG